MSSDVIVILPLCVAMGAAMRMADSRRFPPPWSVEDIGAAFVVKDSANQGVAYLYYDEEPQWRTATKMLSKDEARRIAANIAKLSELFGRA